MWCWVISAFYDCFLCNIWSVAGWLKFDLGVDNVGGNQRAGQCRSGQWRRIFQSCYLFAVFLQQQVIKDEGGTSWHRFTWNKLPLVNTEVLAVVYSKFWKYPENFCKNHLRNSSYELKVILWMLYKRPVLSDLKEIGKKAKQVRPPSGTVVYPHVDLRPHDARFHEGASIAWRLRQLFPSWTLLPGGWPIRPIFGFWESKVLQNGRFPAQDADEPPCKIWRR